MIGTMTVVVRRELSSRGERRTGEGSGGWGSWTAPPAATGRLTCSRMSQPELVELKEQVYKDPRPKEHFDRFHERTRTHEPDFIYEVVRILMSLMAWIFFRVRGHASRARAGRRGRDPRAQSLLVPGPLLPRRRAAAQGPLHGQVAAVQAAAAVGLHARRRLPRAARVRRRGGVHHRGHACSTAATRWRCTPRAGARAPASCRPSRGAGSGGSRCSAARRSSRWRSSAPRTCATGSGCSSRR